MHSNSCHTESLFKDQDKDIVAIEGLTIEISSTREPLSKGLSNFAQCLMKFEELGETNQARKQNIMDLERKINIMSLCHHETEARICKTDQVFS